MAQTSNFLHDIEVEAEADVRALEQACGHLLDSARKVLSGEVQRFKVCITGEHHAGHPAAAPAAAETTETPAAPEAPAAPQV